VKLAHFKLKGTDKQRVGILVGEVICDVAQLARAATDAGGDSPEWLGDFVSMLDVIRRGPDAIDDLKSLLNKSPAASAIGHGRATVIAYSLDRIDFLPAVNARKVLAIGRNYADHAAEGGGDLPKAPLIFNKLPSSLNAHEAPIVLPSISAKVDYEAELAVVIGRRAKQVSEAKALDYVFGYTLINDVTARDLQRSDGQWTRGKGLDTFAPLGPFITTRDEIEDVQNLKIEGLLNGQVMQSSNTSKMIFRVAYLISYISQGITLEPGDVIATGTPEGVGFFRDPPVVLKAGDVFEVRIEKLGTLRNPVRD
jgi:2-keto-4-pentenoate hydratase/2-oxohepta-3-ene-1,7-dioic acid hydratase in catechol pathway